MPTLPPPRRRRRAATAGPPPDSAGPRFRPLSAGDRIIASLAPHIRFEDHLIHRIVCRAWRRSCRLIGRAPPPFPWLMLPPPPPPAQGPDPVPGAPQRRVFYDIPGGKSYAYPVPASYRYVASRSGWLVLSDSGPPRRLVVLNPITGGELVVPWPFGEDLTEGFHVVMTASACDPACFLVVATDRLIKYCRPAVDVSKWVTLRVQGFRYDAACSDLVSVGTTVYLLDGLRKLWRADLAAAEPKVEHRKMALVLPQGERWRLYLVESLGHVLLVVWDEHQKHLGLYSLNWVEHDWTPTPASGIGGRVLLLGRGCSVAVPASAAAGRSPGTFLVVHHPSRWSSLHIDSCGGGGEQPWFWTESRLGDELGDDQLVLRKTVPQRPGEFTIGDSFWFFPAIDKCN